MYVVQGLAAVWSVLSDVARYRWFVYARADMHWLIDPLIIVKHIRSDLQRRAADPAAPLLYTFDTENWYGANDRFAVCNRASAEAYFTRAAMLSSHNGNTETLLAASLKAAKASILLMPTLGTLACCAPSARDCHTRLCATIWVNDTARAAGGRTLDVKYIFEAQAAVQNAEHVLRGTSRIAPCSGGAASSVERLCEAPRNPASPHACLPVRALCIRPVQPTIEWRALWHRNATDWYRWLSPPPWR